MILPNYYPNAESIAFSRSNQPKIGNENPNVALQILVPISSKIISPFS